MEAPEVWYQAAVAFMSAENQVAPLLEQKHALRMQQARAQQN